MDATPTDAYWYEVRGWIGIGDGWNLLRRNDLLTVSAKYGKARTVEKWKFEFKSGPVKSDVRGYFTDQGIEIAVEDSGNGFEVDGDHMTLCDTFLPYDTQTGPSQQPVNDDMIFDIIDLVELNNSGSGNLVLINDKLFLLPGARMVPNISEEEHRTIEGIMSEDYIKYYRPIRDACVISVFLHMMKSSMMLSRSRQVLDTIPHFQVATFALFFALLAKNTKVVCPFWYGRREPGWYAYSAYIVQGIVFENEEGRLQIDISADDGFYSKVYSKNVTASDIHKDTISLVSRSGLAKSARDSSYIGGTGDVYDILHNDIRTVSRNSYRTDSILQFQNIGVFQSVVNPWFRSIKIFMSGTYDYEEDVYKHGLYDEEHDNVMMEPWRFAIIEKSDWSYSDLRKLMLVDFTPSPLLCKWNVHGVQAISREEAGDLKSKNYNVLLSMLDADEPPSFPMIPGRHERQERQEFLDEILERTKKPLRNVTASDAPAPRPLPSPAATTFASPPAIPKPTSSTAPATPAAPSLPIQRLIEASQQREIRKAVELLSPGAPRTHHSRRSQHRSQHGTTRSHRSHRTHRLSHSRSHSRSRSRSGSRSGFRHTRTRIPTSRYS